MFRKYAPPFVTSALVQTAGGEELIRGMRHLSLAIITPSLDREMFSGSVDAGFVLVLPFHHGDLEPDCVGVSTRGGSGGRARSGEMRPTLAVGWRASVLRAKEAGRFRKVTGVSIVAAGGQRSR